MSAAAQLITNPQAIPRGSNPPVVLLNGFETNCAGASFQHVFGIADLVLQANGRASLFFNNCNIPGSPSIEKLGDAFGSFLQSLTYTDGQPVATVDVIAYSMGGLILRSYLEGKQEALATFNPPPAVPIRKAVFIATPHFGTPVGSLALGFSVQADELSSGSHFLMDLNTWNQNHDDLRGIDAVAIAGTGGTGVTVSPGFDDGLVALSSASLEFYGSGRTRVLPLCHVASPGLLTQIGLCPSGAKGIGQLLAATDDNARIVVSFLTGRSEWQTVGQAIEDNSFQRSAGGLLVRARTAGDAAVYPASVSASPANGQPKKLNMSNSEIAWTDSIAAGPVNLSVADGSQSFARSVPVLAGGSQAFVVKPGPNISAVVPSAARIFPLIVTPRMIVSIYGDGLDGSVAALNGTPLAILYVSSALINAVLPASAAPGLNKLTVMNATGLQTVNVWIEPAYPVVFALDQSGSGAAAAVNVTDGMVVTQSNPLHAGDFVALFLTGLGSTERRAGLDYAKLQPVVTVGGMDCPVSYAGAAPGFLGLDQINCRVPAGLAAQSSAPLTVRTGARMSANTTVAVR